MNFLEEFVSNIAIEGIYYVFKWIGIGSKWIFYLGKKSIRDIKEEHWNRLTGFLIFAITLCTTIYFVN